MKLTRLGGALALALMLCAPALATDPIVGKSAMLPAGAAPAQAIYCPDDSGALQHCSFAGGPGGGGAVADVFNTGPIAAGTLNAAYVQTVANGQNVVTFTMSGLTASAATLTLEGSNDNGPTWTNVYSPSGVTGQLSNTFTADGSFSANVAGRTRIRLRVSAPGSGTITVTSNLSVAIREVRLDAPLPPGTNIIGAVTIADLGAKGDAAWDYIVANPTLLSIERANALKGKAIADAVGTAADASNCLTDTTAVSEISALKCAIVQLKAVVAALPTALGQKTQAASLAVTTASDGPLGNQADAAWSGSGNGSVVSIAKTLATSGRQDTANALASSYSFGPVMTSGTAYAYATYAQRGFMAICTSGSTATVTLTDAAGGTVTGYPLSAGRQYEGFKIVSFSSLVVTGGGSCTLQLLL